MANPEQIQADIDRWRREIRTWRATGLTDDHPNIRRRLDRISIALHLLSRGAPPEASDGTR